MRDYGRFGYFFKRKLKKTEALTLKYRFVVEQSMTRLTNRTHRPTSAPTPAPIASNCSNNL